MESGVVEKKKIIRRNRDYKGTKQKRVKQGRKGGKKAREEREGSKEGKTRKKVRRIHKNLGEY